jgi:ketosteroid isomerase-like protein
VFVPTDPTAAPADETQDPVDVIKAFLDRMSALDGEGVAALFDDDIRFEHMFMPDGGPFIVTSKAQLKASLMETLDRFADWHISLTNAYRIVGDPATVITEWESTGLLKSGATYENNYIGIQTIANGKIVWWREYAHPAPMVDVWQNGVRPDVGDRPADAEGVL